MESLNSGTLVIAGFYVYPRDIDARMWSYAFTEFLKCPECGFRTDFFAHNSKFRPLRATPDFASTWDGELIVSKAFRQFCETNDLAGLDYKGFDCSDVFFHAVPSSDRSVAFNAKDFNQGRLCGKCGNPEHLVTGRSPFVLLASQPLGSGFWTSDLLFGSGNEKGPSTIVNHRTKDLLEMSGLKGFHSFEPVYAVSTPALEAAIKTYPPIKLATVKPRGKRRAVPARVDLEPFINLLAEVEPAFHCKASGQARRRTMIRVKHELRDQPSSAALSNARELLGRHGKLLVDFYKHNDGVELYRELHGGEVGIRLFPIEQWVTETAAMKKVFATMPKKERPEVLNRAVAFGEPPSTGHHFAIVTKGEGAGSILLTNHETLSADEFATDFNEFLKIICTDPVDLLVNQLGCYVRYRDGKTSLEWIPETYLPDASQARGKKGVK